MKCADAIQEIPLYCYGEPQEREDELETHLAGCKECSAELSRHRAMLDLLDTRPAFADSALLSQCRVSLRQELNTASSAKRSSHGKLAAWLEALRNISEWHIPMRVPVGALALVALGWFGARYTPEKFGGVRASLASEPMFSNVRSVEPDGSGRILISVDDVHRRVVTGTPQDPTIQGLLLSAAKEESNPGMRVESIGLLNNRADSQVVRSALLEAVSRDPNPGVRLKALDGLKAYASDPAVRNTLASVLLQDDNPGVRVQAIDLLTSRRDEALVGVLQQIVEREDNTYVRARCKKLLQEMKASVGTY